MSRYMPDNTTADYIVKVQEAKMILGFSPTADVEEVRHGEWRKVNEQYPRYVCTVCNHLFNNKNYNYCPFCGAKMDGERREQNEG